MAIPGGADDLDTCDLKKRAAVGRSSEEIRACKVSFHLQILMETIRPNHPRQDKQQARNRVPNGDPKGRIHFAG